MCSAIDDPTTYDHEPNDAGTACRHCGLAAEPGTISPDALFLLAQYATTDHDGTRARYTVALTQSDINRRRAALDLWGTLGQAFARETQEALAAVAPSTNPHERVMLPPDPTNQRQREAADVWARSERARHYIDTDNDGTGADLTAANYAERHDAHTERELLAGRMDANGRVWERYPPLYRAGLPPLPGSDWTDPKG